MLTNLAIGSTQYMRRSVMKNTSHTKNEVIS